MNTFKIGDRVIRGADWGLHNQRWSHIYDSLFVIGTVKYVNEFYCPDYKAHGSPGVSVDWDNTGNTYMYSPTELQLAYDTKVAEVISVKNLTKVSTLESSLYEVKTIQLNQNT